MKFLVFDQDGIHALIWFEKLKQNVLLDLGRVDITRSRFAEWSPRYMYCSVSLNTRDSMIVERTISVPCACDPRLLLVFIYHILKVKNACSV